MEVLTLLLQRSSRIDASFKFHNRCEKQRIINFCFADDLFIFASGNISYVTTVMSTLQGFMKMSGLVPRIPKSTIFFCNVPDHIRMAILKYHAF